MTLEDMNYNISARQIKRQEYQQKYFVRQRQLDTIQIQVEQLRQQLQQADAIHNEGLAGIIRNKIRVLIERWNKVRSNVE